MEGFGLRQLCTIELSKIWLGKAEFTRTQCSKKESYQTALEYLREKSQKKEAAGPWVGVQMGWGTFQRLEDLDGAKFRI